MYDVWLFNKPGEIQISVLFKESVFRKTCTLTVPHSVQFVHSQTNHIMKLKN